MWGVGDGPRRNAGPHRTAGRALAGPNWFFSGGELPRERLCVHNRGILPPRLCHRCGGSNPAPNAFCPFPVRFFLHMTDYDFGVKRSGA